MRRATHPTIVAISSTACSLFRFCWRVIFLQTRKPSAKPMPATRSELWDGPSCSGHPAARIVFTRFHRARRGFNVPHAFRVDAGPAQLMFMLSPGGFEALAREMGEPARKRALPPEPEVALDDASIQQLAGIAATHGNEILGPPPMM